MYKLLSNYIDKKRDYIVSFTKQLIDIPTVNPPGNNYGKIVDLLEKELRRSGFTTRKIVTPKSILKKHGINRGSKRINLVADWQTGSAKTFHINGHYDVVPASGRWKRDPFKARVEKNKLFGRGSEDMKGTISAMVFGAAALKRLGYKPAVNIQLSFTPDEETGGRTGFAWLVDKNKIKADYGMSEGYSSDCVSCGNKGMLWINISCVGKAAHASVPYRGVNSFNAMLKVGNELLKLNLRFNSRKTDFKMKSERDKISTMVMGGELKGGNKVNIVSPESVFSIDRRLIPGESLVKAKKEIRDVLRRCEKSGEGYKFKMNVLAQDDAVSVDPKDKVCRAVAEAVKTVLKKKARFMLMSGATDTRYLIKKGVSSIGYSARGGESWHGDDEFVYISSILDTAKIYALTMLNIKR